MIPSFCPCAPSSSLSTSPHSPPTLCCSQQDAQLTTKIQHLLAVLHKKIYDMETSYLQDPGQCGNVLKGFEGFLSSSKNTALYGVSSI
ncbi:hypothetical protein HN51_040496 [Arachis hypogaea]